MEVLILSDVLHLWKHLLMGVDYVFNCFPNTADYISRTEGEKIWS